MRKSAQTHLSPVQIKSVIDPCWGHGWGFSLLDCYLGCGVRLQLVSSTQCPEFLSKLTMAASVSQQNKLSTDS